MAANPWPEGKIEIPDWQFMRLFALPVASPDELAKALPAGTNAEMYSAQANREMFRLAERAFEEAQANSPLHRSRLERTLRATRDIADRHYDPPQGPFDWLAGSW